MTISDPGKSFICLRCKLSVYSWKMENMLSPSLGSKLLRVEGDIMSSKVRLSAIIAEVSEKLFNDDRRYPEHHLLFEHGG